MHAQDDRGNAQPAYSKSHRHNLRSASPADTIPRLHSPCKEHHEMSSAIWARRAIAVLVFVLLLMATAMAQQATPSSQPLQVGRPQAGQAAGQQSDQHPMASAMISADRKTQGPKAPSQPIRNDVVIRGGMILTATHGTIQNGSIYV